MIIPIEKNLARLMVRRHLRSWSGSDLISENLLVAMFIQKAHEHPDMPFKHVAALVDAELHQLIAITLGRDPEEPVGLDS